MPKLRTWQWAVIAVAALVGIILLSGCGAERKCLRGHEETTVGIISYVTIGNVMTPIYGPVTNYVCDEYAPEPASS